MVESNRVTEFRKIAEEKGYTFSYDKAAFEEPVSPSKNDFESRKLHIDLKMVDQTIRDAILSANEVAKSDVAHSHVAKRIKKKLEFLLEAGSAEQKIAFSNTTGSYYFPEDINEMVVSAISNGNRVSDDKEWDCLYLCYTVCRCLFNHQDCRDMCRWVCG